MANLVQGQNSCCNLNVPEFTQQVLVDRFTQDQGIGPAVMERLLSESAAPTLQGLELDHGRTAPFPVGSFQSRYCTFLV
jgi:hypothetical protein